MVNTRKNFHDACFTAKKLRMLLIIHPLKSQSFLFFLDTLILSALFSKLRPFNVWGGGNKRFFFVFFFVFWGGGEVIVPFLPISNSSVTSVIN